MTYEECKGTCDHCDCEWATIGAHDFDDDGCCVKCGFDGAEWHWWKHSTYEGKAQTEAKMPRCKVPNADVTGGRRPSGGQTC